MLGNGVLDGFLFTLVTIAALVAVIVVATTVVYLWVLTTSLRKKVSVSSPIRLLRLGLNLVGSGIGCTTSWLWKTATILPRWLWSKLTTYSSKLWQKCRQEQKKIYLGLGFMAVLAFPFSVILLLGAPVAWVLGIAAAGATLGMFVTPYIGWRVREGGVMRSVGASFLTIVGGAWSSTFLILFLAAMASD